MRRATKKKPSAAQAAKLDGLRQLHLHELLGALGNDKIDLDTFWRNMWAHGLTNSDIDAYCAEHGRWDRRGVSDQDIADFWAAVKAVMP